MAEMTVEKAVEWLTSDKAFGQECYSRKQIAALLEQQAQEIAKKDRMIEKAKFIIANGIDDYWAECNADIMQEWLEKEAEVQG